VGPGSRGRACADAGDFVGGDDPMLVPGEIADALAHLLVIFMIAVEVGSAA
jgi:hypothetical protein